MMNLVIYGAGPMGRCAYWDYREEAYILFYVDSRCGEIQRVYDKDVYLPEILAAYPGVMVLLAVGEGPEAEEAESELRNLGVRNIIRYIPSHVAKQPPIVLYGSGRWAEMACEEYRDKRNVVFLVDLDERRQGKRVGKRTVYPPEILREYPDIPVEVVVEEGDFAIEYLRGIGVQDVTVHLPECVREELAGKEQLFLRDGFVRDFARESLDMIMDCEISGGVV